MHLILVDGTAFTYRAFHALAPLTRASDGLSIGAVAGFCEMLWRLRRAAPLGEPTHFGVVFDHEAPSFRQALYADYKAHRPYPPDDLLPQFELVRRATRAFRLPCLMQKGWEADDLIATYAVRAHERGASVVIVSSDKDLMQVVRPGIVMLDSFRDRVIDRDAVRERFGVWPERMVDLQALAGDAVDNVPGIVGVGPKTAAKLLNEFGDLDAVLANAGAIKQRKCRENVERDAEQARLSRRLVELSTDVPLDVPLEELGLKKVGLGAMRFCQEMELLSLRRRIRESMS